MLGLTVDWTWTPVSIVAAYAAVVSTGLLAVSVITLIVGLRRESPSIKLQVSWSLIIDPLGRDPSLTFLTFDVANAGKRPVTIKSVGFLGGRGRQILVPPYSLQTQSVSWGELPFELTEGRNKSLHCRPEKAFEGFREKTSTPPQRAFVRDAVDHYYTCKVHTRTRDKIWGDASYRPWWKPWEQGWWPL